jgi:hypothetical protein
MVHWRRVNVHARQFTRIGKGIMASLTYEQERARGIPSERPFTVDAERREDAEQRRFSLPAGYELQPLPGSEFPPTLYRLIALAYLWLFGTAWYAFGRDTDTEFLLAMGAVLAAVFFGIPMTMRKTASPRLPRPQRPQQTVERLRIASARVETATGSLPAWRAWIEVLLIPFALALAATLIGAAYLAAVKDAGM